MKCLLKGNTLTVEKTVKEVYDLDALKAELDGIQIDLVRFSARKTEIECLLDEAEK